MTAPPGEIRVLVNERESVVRSAIARLGGIVCAGAVGDPADVVGAVAATGARVVVYDEAGLGHQAVSESLAGLVAPRAVVLAGDGVPPARHLAGGAFGLVPRTAAPAELGLAIRAVAGGGMYLAADHAGRLLETLTGGSGVRGLTLRQHEVLDLLATGASNAEIASVLSVSEKTVKSHVSGILNRLNLRNRTQVLAYLMSCERIPVR
ncbi:hypothetical protein BLA60_03300 [Actinophytocola xinjiangensis]|uniref:HTH luxR-type domain-containing protein n=1 Tax=Actinophytocola xinjiangensis TaxID=485602 RepID=A0A7Z1B1G1_9PSEU|nr:response regulator transcription factor [Actinophytocola xinjiangensis]OLF14186.1 hypothetical protein BLA60_03300 [Actinophytocola xinjiangensis]